MPIVIKEKEMNFAFWFYVICTLGSLYFSYKGFTDPKNNRAWKSILGFGWIVFAAVFVVEAVKQFVW
jgi:hypothetical protein